MIFLETESTAFTKQDLIDGIDEGLIFECKNCDTLEQVKKQVKIAEEQLNAIAHYENGGLSKEVFMKTLEEYGWDMS